MTYSKIELSQGNTTLWITSPFNARVRIADIKQHSPMNGINSEAYGKLFAAAPELLDGANEAYKWLMDFVNNHKNHENARCDAYTVALGLKEAIKKAKDGDNEK